MASASGLSIPNDAEANPPVIMSKEPATMKGLSVDWFATEGISIRETPKKSPEASS
jgi:hypothetical protein